MEIFMVYLWLKLDGMLLTSIIAATISGFLLACVSVFLLDYEEDCEIHLRKFRKKLVILFSVAISIVVFLPDSKQTAILLGTHYAVELRDSPEGQKVMSLIRKKANEYLDAELKAVAAPTERK